MKSLAAVARLEVERSWLLLPLALAVGFAPFGVMPFIDAPLRAAHGVASWLAFLFAAGTAILLGTATISGDLATGRLGFYFSRPLPWWAIWAGKLAVALALTLAVAALVLVPTAIFGPGGDPLPVGWVARGVMLAILLIGLSHWGAVAARSRSAWLVLDLLAIPLVVWGVNDALRRALEQGYFTSLMGLRTYIVLFTVAVLAAGAAQVAVGRTSAVRSHAVASLTGWALVGVLVASLQVITRTAFGSAPQGLDSVWVFMPAPSGDTALFAGRERVLGFQSTFQHRFLASAYGIRKVHPYPRFAYGFSFSGDSSHAVWLESGEDGPQLLRYEVSTGDTSSTPIDTPPPWPIRMRRMLADETGARVAILRAGFTSVFDATSGARLARLEDDGAPVEFVALRAGRSDLVYRSTPEGGLEIETLDGSEAAPSGGIAPPANGDWRSLHLDASGERLLVAARGEARLVDAETGEPRAGFAGEPSTLLEGLLLEGGDVLIAGAEPAGTALRHYDASGTLLGELDLGPAHGVQLLETAPGRVVAALSNPGQASSTPGGPADLGERLAVVDTDPLGLVRVEEGLSWRPPQGPWLAARRDRPAGGALLVTRVLSLEPVPRVALLRYDVETGRAEWVAGAR